MRVSLLGVLLLALLVLWAGGQPQGFPAAHGQSGGDDDGSVLSIRDATDLLVLRNILAHPTIASGFEELLGTAPCIQLSMYQDSASASGARGYTASFRFHEPGAASVTALWATYEYVSISGSTPSTPPDTCSVDRVDEPAPGSPASIVVPDLVSYRFLRHILEDAPDHLLRPMRGRALTKLQLRTRDNGAGLVTCTLAAELTRGRNQSRLILSAVAFADGEFGPILIQR